MIDLDFIINKVSKNIEHLEKEIKAKIYNKRYLKDTYYYIRGQNNVLGDILIDLRKDEKIYINNRDKLDDLYNLIDKIN